MFTTQKESILYLPIIFLLTRIAVQAQLRAHKALIFQFFFKAFTALKTALLTAWFSSWIANPVGAKLAPVVG
jgi:hypothetical protein